MEPLRPEGTSKSIDWDNDFGASPLQTGPDGEDYWIADPARPVPEDFDKIFNDNDDLRLAELERISRQVGVGGTIPVEIADELKTASRPSDETDRLGRRAAQDKFQTNVVDPWGNRRPRFGVREKAARSKAILERMQMRDEVIDDALADIQYDLTGTGQRAPARPPPDSEGDGGGWVVRRADGSGQGRGDFAARRDPDRPGYVQIRSGPGAADGKSPYSKFAQRQEAQRQYSQELQQRQRDAFPPQEQSGGDRGGSPDLRVDDVPPLPGARGLTGGGLRRRVPQSEREPAVNTPSAPGAPSAPDTPEATTPKRRGRPPKAAATMAAADIAAASAFGAAESAAPASGSAPAKKAAAKTKATAKTKAASKKSAAKKSAAAKADADVDGVGGEDAPKKRGPGRPRKVKPEETTGESSQDSS